MLVCRLPIVLFTLACVLARPPAGEARPWADADAVAVEVIGDVRISPDGTTALVNVVRPDVSKNAFVAGYRLVALADGKATAMPPELLHPRWAPGGNAIAWLRPAKAGASAIVLTDTRGRALRAVTAGERSVLAFSWSPDGSRIAAIETPLAAAAPAARMRWMTPETDYLDTRPPKRDVYIVDVGARSERPLTRDSWSYGGPVTDHDPSWSADGTQLAVVRQPSPVYGDFERAEYVALDVAGNGARDIVGHSFFAYPASMPPIFAPAGRGIAYVHTSDGLLPSREDIFVAGRDGSAARDVTAGLDRDLWSCTAGNAEWQADSLIANLLDGVSMRLYRVPADGGAPQALTPPEGSVESFSTSPRGRIAYAWSTPSAPAELYVLDPGVAPRRVTHFGGLRDLPVAVTRLIEWRAADGHALHGQLTVPAITDPSSAPLVVEPHGGPQCADDSSFSGFAQYLASNGYAYFRPDPRGSDGYGDWSYKAIVGDWGAGPMSDDLAGVDAVLASGVGSRDRLYLEGGSYGGYLTSWIVTHDRRFKAAVAQVPVTNLLLEYSLSESPNIVRRFFGAKPALDQALLARESPITYAGDERTPLLVMIGLRDTRAPYAQAIEFYKTVEANGTEARLLADSLAGHGPGDPRGAALWFRSTMAWFVQHGAPPLPNAVLPK